MVTCLMEREKSEGIGKFFSMYRETRKFLLKYAEGNEKTIDALMMQMTALWYLQKRGFFGGDTDYFVTAFGEVTAGKTAFDTYGDFLRYLFDKLGGDEITEESVIGRVIPIGSAMLLTHCNITLPDACFYDPSLKGTASKKLPLLNLFGAAEERGWTIDAYTIGSIYENIMAENERKKTGAYYTPERITAYICENTITPYITERINESFNEDFKHIDDVIESNNGEVLRYLFDLIKGIRIVDPSAGAGHFIGAAVKTLLGVYERIYEKAKEIGTPKRLEIASAGDDGEITAINLLDVTDANTRKFLVTFFVILPRNVYGVDINPMAVKVAKLRLFLTMMEYFNGEVAESVKIWNAKFNIKAGDALIGYTECGGRKASGLMTFIKKGRKTNDIGAMEITPEVKSYIEKVSKSSGIGDGLIERIEGLGKIAADGNPNWKEIEEVISTKRDLGEVLNVSLNSKYAAYIGDLLEEVSERFSPYIDGLLFDEYRITSRIRNKPFHWVFEFPEVFSGKSGGFDAVLGNPPYIMEVRNNADVFGVYRNLPIGRKYYGQKMDLFYFFIIRGMELLKRGGMLGYIVQEYLFTRTYAEKIVNFIFTETSPMEFVMFKDFKVFKGASGQHNMLVFLKKETPRHRSEITIKILKNSADGENVYRALFDAEENDVFRVFTAPIGAVYDRERRSVTIIDNVGREIWNEIHKNAVYLGKNEIHIGVDVHQDRVTKKHAKKYGGLKEGEGIFVLSEGEYLAVEWTDDEKRILKPFYFAEEFDAYAYPNGNKYWLIYTDKTAVDMIRRHPQKYPNIRRHLDRFKNVITSDNRPYGIHRPRQAEWFEDGGKIIGVRKTKYPKFAVTPITAYTNQATIIIRPVKMSPYYIAAILNSSLAHWIFSKIKTQGSQLQIDKGVVMRFPIRFDGKFTAVLEKLGKYVHTLKRYSADLSERDYDTEYVIDYLENLIDCLVYELYLGKKVNIAVNEIVGKILADADPDGNTAEERISEIREMFGKLNADKDLNERLYIVKLNEWIKAIYTSIKR